MFRPKPGYRLELHVLKSHGASRLNRDGADRPKTINIGGVRRLRISSQSEKYSIRESDIFKQFLEEADQKYGATRMIRTRRAGEIIKDRIQGKILEHGRDPMDYEEQIDAALASLSRLFARNRKVSDTADTKQAIAFSETEIEYLAEIMFSVGKDGEIAINDCADTLKNMNVERNSVGPLSPELQLFGRFTTASVFLKNIDTPLQLNHGFTVHEARIEHDYWTTVDDLNKQSGKQGGAHLDLRPFGAGVFYHYYCLDVPLLSRNIAAAFPVLEPERNLEMTQDLIAAFLYAALIRNPVGGQTGHANHDLPSCAYVTYGNAFPYSAQSVFECPVQPEQHGGYITAAKKCFEQWRKERKKRYGIFCGFEQCMGLGETDVDLQTMVEASVEEATPAIRRELFSA